MEFRFTEEQENFRKEVRAFLDAEIKAGSFKPHCDAWMTQYSPEFSRKLGQRKWLGMTWPKEYGGQERSTLDRLILTEELLRYGAPTCGHWFSDRQIGPSLIHYGSDEQRQEFLPGILRGETSFTIGMSEPEAGSDLASLKTKAREDGDYYVIDGQKIWSSGAHYAQYMYAVVRTDPDAPKHKGISEFIIDLKLPGITVNTIEDITGDRHFNEVFFDSVRVHKKYMIGKKNMGWYQITPQLDFERSGIERVMSNYPLFDGLINYVKETKRNGKPLSEDPLIRQKLAELKVEFEVGRLMIYKVAWMQSKNRVPNVEPAMAKAYCAEFQQRLCRAAMEILGPQSQLMSDSKRAVLRGMAAASLLFSPGYTLQGGTTEILRGIVAGRGLGLTGK
ncbi:MAG: acyl-CoA dehydrogenase family protein [Dehalococcoidia bacterium]|nr:acyl-CoA dehydrogenase family protein [Dehalococcoidia bacterium]